MKALALFTIAALALATGVERAVAEFGAEAQERTVPQSKSETGTSVKPLPPEEHKGVIEPPDVGDKDIYTEVPNPDAGHPEEVIPPSELPEQAPETNPR